MEALAPWHLVLIAVVAVVLFFGWRRLPNMARSAGRSLRIFKSEARDLAADTRDVQATLHIASQEAQDAFTSATARAQSEPPHPALTRRQPPQRTQR